MRKRAGDDDQVDQQHKLANRGTAEMTYIVSGVALNSTHSLTTRRSCHFTEIDEMWTRHRARECNGQVG